MPGRPFTVLAAIAAACLALAAQAGSSQASPADAQSADTVFGGLGSWLSIFAERGWAHPGAVVAALQRHGVKTLYLQTSNYSQRVDIVHRGATGTFIDDAHAAGIQVVAWYLPSLAHPVTDRRRALAAIRFRSPMGQGFDAFALDIEASLVRNVDTRNTRLLALSRALRNAAPADYPLGAIVPSPVGMRRHPKYWPNFPFADLATTYDTFLPMAYFSYYAKEPAAAYAYAHDVITAIRTQSAQSDIPIHIIGGIAGAAPISAFAAFIRAARDCDVAGISLYAFYETSASEWSALRKAATPGSDQASC